MTVEATTTVGTEMAFAYSSPWRMLRESGSGRPVIGVTVGCGNGKVLDLSKDMVRASSRISRSVCRASKGETRSVGEMEGGGCNRTGRSDGCPKKNS